MAATATKKRKEDEVKIEPRIPVDPKRVKRGDVMAFTYWAEVERVSEGGNGQTTLQVRNLDNNEDFQVIGNDLVAAAASANQFAREETISMTGAAELLVSAYNTPFTVVFEKQDGEERTLRGRLVRPEPLLGRSHVEDLDIDDTNPDKRRRQVDHRTISVLIIHGVKYTVK